MKVQSAALAMAIAFALISGACSSSRDQPGIRRTQRRTPRRERHDRHSQGHGGDRLSERDRVRRRRGRNVERDVVVPEGEWERWTSRWAGLDPRTCTSVTIRAPSA